MKLRSSNVIKSKSQLTYSYATIKITQSRIDKGLIAIPVALAGWFPKRNDTIQVCLNDSPSSQTKQYSSYNSSTRECRIGGMREWFQQNDFKSGDEIVIQVIDKERFIYKLIPERNFIVRTKELQNGFDNSKTEEEASEKIAALAQWTSLNEGKVVLSEYHRLINTVRSEDRLYVDRRSSRARENVPANLRTLLEYIYQGHCQVCDFWFLKSDRKPYFEVHHLDPVKGHHPKNLAVVCGNCHNQFEYACVEQEFNSDGWLIRISFNESMYPVKQPVLSTKMENYYKELFIE